MSCWKFFLSIMKSAKLLHLNDVPTLVPHSKIGIMDGMALSVI